MALTAVENRQNPEYSRRRQAVTVLAGLWVVLGVFVDGWAHLNRPGLETFFTPWHALLYSGAAALFGWLLLPRSEVTRRDRRWAWAAATIFSLGGAGDLLWHVAFGVETGLSALVSPTHLLLLLGGLIGLTAPLRESRTQPLTGFRSVFPVVAAVALAAALSAFFLLYLSPFTTDAPTLPVTAIPEGAPGHDEAEAPAVAGLAAYLVTTAVIVLPVLALRSRGWLPFGTITALLTVVASLSTGVTEFEQPAAPVAALVAGLIADVVVRASRGLPDAAQAPLIGAAVPLLLWTGQLTALALTAEVRWPAELILGVVVLSTILGAALGLVAGAQTPRSAAPPV